MIDMHSHILYDIDDGARTLDEAVAMGRLAASDGIRIIAATPHSPSSPAGGRYDVALIRERLALLNVALRAEQVPVEIVGGTEICYAADLAAHLERGMLLPYSTSRSILLELPDDSLPPALEALLFSVQLAGYRVVLAHPERIRDIQQRPNQLRLLIERGVLMQLTAEALLGAQGERLRQTAETLLTHGMIHLIASDAHGLPPRRPPLLARAHARAAELVGIDVADCLVTTTPAALLTNASVQLFTPEPIVRRRRW
jgi:protein-tyrosine phosphatase